MGQPALDLALVVISVDPDVGEPIPGNTDGPHLRQNTDEEEAQQAAETASWPRVLGRQGGALGAPA